MSAARGSTPSEKVVVLGAGGHAKVVVQTLLDAGHEIAAILDDTPEKIGATLLGFPVSGSIRDAEQDPGQAAIIAIGSNRAREVLAESLRFRWISVVHPSAVVAASVKLGAGTAIFAGAVIQPDATVGDHVIVNTAAVVDHDCKLGDFVHLAPGSRLAGTIQVGEGAFIGLGAAVLPGKRIGEWAVVGAGAVVTKDVPPYRTVVGVPARPLDDFPQVTTDD